MSEYNYEICYIIPVYNHSNYLRDLFISIDHDIESLSCSFELVIIDDGSTDSSASIVKEWYENNKSLLNIKYYSRANKGLTYTLNELVSISSSKYLRLCASDDIILPGSTQLLYNQFSDDIIAVTGDGIVINDDSKVINKSSIAYHGGDVNRLINLDTMPNELILHWCIAGPSTLIRKSIYSSLKYKENESIDDFYLYLYLLEKNGLKIIKDKVCKYRIHSNNTSKTIDRTRRITNLNSFLNIILDFENMYSKYPSLHALEYLTKSKISFLNKHYLQTFKYFFYYKYKIFTLSDGLRR